MDALKNTLRWAGLIAAWTFQYTIWVWLILAGRILTATLKIGAFGVLLLFVPILGWIVLAILLLRRPAPAQPGARSMWKPWGTR